jgi:hypothetical protein
MSSGIWLATRRTGVLDDEALVVEPTNRFRVLSGFAGISMPSAGCIVAVMLILCLQVDKAM